MPEQATRERAAKAKREGKAPTTQAGEYVREEIEHIREGKHGARSAKQAIAIGLSKARRAGVKLPKPPATATERTKQSAASADRAAKRGGTKRPSRTRARAAEKALKREGRAAASKTALSRHAKAVAKRRSPSARKASARKAAKTRRRRAAAE